MASVAAGKRSTPWCSPTSTRTTCGARRFCCARPAFPATPPPAPTRAPAPCPTSAPAARSCSRARPVEAAGFLIEPFSIPHDANEPIGLVIEDAERLPRRPGGRPRHPQPARLGPPARPRRPDPRNQPRPPRCCSNGPYPWVLKQRIAGRHGHLSNGDAADGLPELLTERLQMLVLYHLSRTNNTPALAAETVGIKLDEERAPTRGRALRAGSAHHWLELRTRAACSSVSSSTTFESDMATNKKTAKTDSASAHARRARPDRGLPAAGDPRSRKARRSPTPFRGWASTRCDDLRAGKSFDVTAGGRLGRRSRGAGAADGRQAAGQRRSSKTSRSRSSERPEVRCGVVVFPGSNCDHDVYHVLKHVLEQEVVFLWHGERTLKECELVVLPGGFSYGDYLRAGAMAAQARGDAVDPPPRRRGRPGRSGSATASRCCWRRAFCPAPCGATRACASNAATSTCGSSATTCAGPTATGRGRCSRCRSPTPKATTPTAAEKLDALEDNKQIVFRYCNADGQLDDGVQRQRRRRARSPASATPAATCSA